MSLTLGRLLLRQPLLDVTEQPAHLDELLHERRELRRLVFLSAALVADDAVRRVDRDRIPVLDGIDRFDALEDRKPRVDAVPVEDPRERFRDDARHAGAYQRDRRDFARGAATEVRVGDDEI